MQGGKPIKWIYQRRAWVRGGRAGSCAGRSPACLFYTAKFVDRLTSALNA